MQKGAPQKFDPPKGPLETKLQQIILWKLNMIFHGVEP